MLSARGAYIELSREEEDALSLCRHAGRFPCPVTIT
jgi:hypothetical protein